MDIRFSLDDPDKMRLHLQNRELVLEALPGFILDRLKKPENREVFSSAAEEVLGGPVAVRITELSRDQSAVRDINELRQFKEVRFIS